MKKILFSLLIASCTTLVGNAAVIELSGSLSTQTLSAENCYYLKGCVTVPAGSVLTINAGVVIRCQAQSSLTILRNGQLFANGTSSNPIVFTSDQAVNSRTPGHWAGIAVLGNAVNNVVNGGGGNLDVVRCNTYSGGGNNDADNSGVLKFMRIEYAGKGTTGATFEHGLFLNSVGSGTEVHDIQVSECLQDAFMFAGGTVEAKNLISLNAYRNDFTYTYGNRSKTQFIVALRMDVNAHTASPVFAHGMVIENNTANSTYTPFTAPLISNATLLDPSYCGRTNSPNIKNGIVIRSNGKASIRNSVVSQWGDYGFYIADAASVANTASNTLNFSYNALMAKSPINYATGASWATGCGGSLSSMTAWITGSGLVSCREAGNNFALSAFGYSSTICDNYCTTPPTLTYSGSSLNTTDFSAPFHTFFTSTTHKGAIGSTDFSSGWANYCPQSATYCNLSALKTSKAATIRFSPNPASARVEASFETLTSGLATLVLMDRITGKALRTVQHKVMQAGAQTIPFSVSGLLPGVYPVSIQLSGGEKIQGQLVVK